STDCGFSRLRLRSANIVPSNVSGYFSNKSCCTSNTLSPTLRWITSSESLIFFQKKFFFSNEKNSSHFLRLCSLHLHQRHPSAHHLRAPHPPPCLASCIALFSTSYAYTILFCSTCSSSLKIIRGWVGSR